LHNLIERGLRVDESLLFVIDGGKGLRKSLRDVFGDRAIVQRCQVHKLRNVLRFDLPKTFCRTFSTTNAIENMNGCLRRVARDVKRWRDETMSRRWVALGVAEAQRGFRRVKGHAHLKVFIAALPPSAFAAVAPKKKVA
jgi:transposase-like protein